MTEVERGEYFYASKDALFNEIRHQIVEEIEVGLRERERFALALCGGRTPAPLFRTLSKVNLDWGRVDVHMVDERWVCRDHEASNEKMLRVSLFRNRGARAKLMPLPPRELSTEEAALHHNRRLIGQPWNLDLTLLGMGEDGHVASIFPGDSKSNRVIAGETTGVYCATEAPSGYRERVGLSYAGLLGSSRILLLITGDLKRDLYCAGVPNDQGKWLPVHHLMNQRKVPLTVFWAP